MNGMPVWTKERETKMLYYGRGIVNENRRYQI